MKRAQCTIVILSLALAGCRGPSYAPTMTPDAVGVRILATTTTHPLLQNLVTHYERPGTLLTVNSAAASWPVVEAKLRAGEFPYAMTTYAAPETDWWVAPLGQDAIAVIVHAQNPVNALSARDLRRIFQGQITEWARFGGADMPITVVCQEDGADTQLVFQILVMGERRTTRTARLALSSQGVVDMVARQPGAIGYVSLAYVDERVRPVPLASDGDGVPVLPTSDTINANLYPLRTPIMIVGLEPPADESIYRDLFAWMQSDAGQTIVSEWYEPVIP
ncbi:MAG: substrate-binding domain-containing protein [Anaerolineae bacterium]|nr:substrate-binding domain-containing protein [Anaerolineae bacterium]